MVVTKIVISKSHISITNEAVFHNLWKSHTSECEYTCFSDVHLLTMLGFLQVNDHKENADMIQ